MTGMVPLGAEFQSGGQGRTGDPDTTTLPCGAVVQNAEITSKLKVWDAEKEGARPYNSKTATLDIVQTGPDDEVTIEYTGPGKPASLEVWRHGKKIGTAKGGGTYKYKVTYAPTDDPYDPKRLVTDMLTRKHAPTVYSFKGIPGRTIKVRVFNPDQWKLAIALPPMRGFSAGAKLDNQKTSTTKMVASAPGVAAAGTKKSVSLQYDVSSSKWGKPVTEQEVKRKYTAAAAAVVDLRWKNGVYVAAGASASSTTTRRDTSNDKKDPSVSALPVTLERNGVGQTCDVMKIVGAAITVTMLVTQIIKLIKQAQSAMSVGWYAQFEANVFQGGIEWTWGWKELEKDHRVYFLNAVGAELTLFSVALEIGVGCVLAGFGGQLCVRFTGELKYKVGPVEFGKPKGKDDAPPRQSLGAYETAISGGLYARVKAGAVANIEAAAKLELKFEGDLYFDLKSDFKTNNKCTFPGVVVQLTVTSFFGNRVSKETLTDSKTLYENKKFPGGGGGNPADLKSEKAVADLADQYFTSGWFNITFYRITEKGRYFDSTVDIKRRAVADAFGKYVWGYRYHIDMDRKVIEGLCHSVLKHCNSIGGGALGRDVDVDKLIEWVQGSEFQKLLRDAYAPDKALKRKIKRLQKGA